MPAFAKSISVTLRTHLHQTTASTLRQLCDDANDSVLIENNRVTAGWDFNSFLVTPLISMRIELSSLMAELSLTLSVNGPLRDNILRFLPMLVVNRRCISVDYLPHISYPGVCPEILTLKPCIKPLTEAGVKVSKYEQISC